MNADQNNTNVEITKDAKKYLKNLLLKNKVAFNKLNSYILYLIKYKFKAINGSTIKPIPPLTKQIGKTIIEVKIITKPQRAYTMLISNGIYILYGEDKKRGDISQKTKNSIIRNAQQYL